MFALVDAQNVSLRYLLTTFPGTITYQIMTFKTLPFKKPQLFSMSSFDGDWVGSYF
jgi:hypothetical protein